MTHLKVRCHIFAKLFMNSFLINYKCPKRLNIGSDAYYITLQADEMSTKIWCLNININFEYIDRLICIAKPTTSLYELTTDFMESINKNLTFTESFKGKPLYGIQINQN